MDKVNSNQGNCEKILKYLKLHMKDEISLESDPYFKTITGKYYTRKKMSADWKREYLPVSIEYADNKFLKISIGDNYKYDSSLGEKMAALSNFYLIFKELFGEPIAYYTFKNDNRIYLQWSFERQKEEIDELKGNVSQLDELIIIGEEDTNEFRLSNDVKKTMSRRVELPYEMISLLEDNSDYSKYKLGKPISISYTGKIDGYPVTSFEKKLKQTNN